VAVKTWCEIFGEERATLLGVLRDKEAAAVYRELAEITGLVALPSFRGAS
jgi:hypothetical protein